MTSSRQTVPRTSLSQSTNCKIPRSSTSTVAGNSLPLALIFHIHADRDSGVRERGPSLHGRSPTSKTIRTIFGIVPRENLHRESSSNLGSSTSDGSLLPSSSVFSLTQFNPTPFVEASRPSISSPLLCLAANGCWLPPARTAGPTGGENSDDGRTSLLSKHRAGLRPRDGRPFVNLSFLQILTTLLLPLPSSLRPGVAVLRPGALALGLFVGTSALPPRGAGRLILREVPTCAVAATRREYGWFVKRKA